MRGGAALGGLLLAAAAWLRAGREAGRAVGAGGLSAAQAGERVAAGDGRFPWPLLAKLYEGKEEGWDRIYREHAGDPSALVWNNGGADADIRGLFAERFGDPASGGRRARVLEIGCGLGYDSLALSALGHDVTCAEISPASVRIVPELQEKVPVVIWNIEKNPLEALGLEARGAWDAVLMRSVFMHVAPDFKPRVLRRIRELLRPKTGVFVAKEYDTERSKEFQEAYNRAAGSRGDMVIGPDFTISRAEMEKLLGAAGFEPVTVRETWFHLYGGSQGPAGLLFMAEHG